MIFFFNKFVNHLVLRNENSAVSEIALGQSLHGVGHTGLVEREFLDLGSDLVQGAELEHLSHLRTGNHHRALDADTLHGDAEHGDLGRREIDCEGVDCAVRGHQRKETRGLIVSTHDTIVGYVFFICNLRLVIDLGTSAEEKMVDWLNLSFKLLSLAEDVELLSTEVESFLTLRFVAGEDDNVAAHGSGHLDSNVAQTADAHDGNSISRLDSILVQDSPNSSTSAHQWSGICGVDSLRDLEDAAGINNGSVGEAAGVEIGVAICNSVGAVLVPTLETFVSIVCVC